MPTPDQRQERRLPHPCLILPLQIDRSNYMDFLPFHDRIPLGLVDSYTIYNIAKGYEGLPVRQFQSHKNAHTDALNAVLGHALVYVNASIFQCEGGLGEDKNVSHKSLDTLTHTE